MVPTRGGAGATVRGFCLATAVIVFRSGGFQLWAELPALAPGARCRVGRSVGSGAPETVQWRATGLLEQSSRDTPGTSEIPSRVLEQGPDRQRAPTDCSGGVSSINGASESRCNLDRPACRNRQGQQRIRHRSLPRATAVHEGGFMASGRVSSAAEARSRALAGWRAPGALVWGHRRSRPWRC